MNIKEVIVIIWVILGIVGSIAMTFLYCCLIVSSKCSREEEKNKEKM